MSNSIPTFKRTNNIPLETIPDTAPDAVQPAPFLDSQTPSEKKDACLEALFLTDPYVDRQKLIRLKYPRFPSEYGSILKNESLQSWLHDDTHFLWISGDPFVGKTLLSIFLTRVLERFLQRNEGATLVFYFCSAKDSNRNSAIAVLRGLIYHMIAKRPRLAKHILPYFQTSQTAQETLKSLQTLWKIFQEIVQDPELGLLYCVLDGLDECDEDAKDKLIPWIVDMVAPTDSSKITKSFKLVVTGRYMPNLHGCTQIKLSRKIPLVDDIELYLSAKDKHLVRTNLMEELDQEDPIASISAGINQEGAESRFNDIVDYNNSSGEHGARYGSEHAVDAEMGGRCFDMSILKRPIEEDRKPYCGNGYSESSVGSRPQSSIFDKGSWSKATHPSTWVTSQSTTKDESSRLVPNIPDLIEGDSTLHRDAETHHAGTSLQEIPNPAAEFEDASRDGCEAETTYSIDSTPEDPNLLYIQHFSKQLVQDLKSVVALSDLSDIPLPYFNHTLKAFAWQLHGESSNPFQWEASVILHQKRERIIELLTSKTFEAGYGMNESQDSISEEDDDDMSERQPFSKPMDMVSEWVNGLAPPEHTVEIPMPATQEQDLFQLADYESFIKQSDAYQWLLSKLAQHNQLSIGNHSSMLDIGDKIRNQLRAQGPLHKISRRRKPTVVKILFRIDWNPKRYIQEQGFDVSRSDLLDRILCFTGTQDEAQAITVAEYMRQTWPGTWKPITELLKDLIFVSEGKGCSYRLWSKRAQLSAYIRYPSTCHISVSGGPYFVSEVAEQIGWLAATLRASPISQGVVACYPRTEELNVQTKDEGTPNATVVGSCRIVFDYKDKYEVRNDAAGFCWSHFFHNPVLVSGYPILRRPEPSTGLEMTLSLMTYFIRTRQVVQWDGRIILKGFSSMLVATLATSNVVVWHLIANNNSDERISYIDSRLDVLGHKTVREFHLRNLEGSRHIVGWCANATDFCGHAIANQMISTSGLRKPPASIVIDRLYIEAGQEVVGGLNINLNKKEPPFWLQRESDYPNLLGWVALQPIVFYDVSDRRAWLVDGVSALLHLVRISLHLDTNNPESPYDWVFDGRNLKDTWDGYKGRLAALKTLKDWDNLNLNVYVKEKSSREGQLVTTYSTLGERVCKILHSIEILIDRQVKVASQDGIRFSQTLDPRKGLVGFDIVDVVKPLGPIDTRMKYFDSNSWGNGWIDLIPSIGVTTIFGNGFEELIRPDNPELVCKHWKYVPTGMDYMTATVSTLKMLYEKRLQRAEPDLGIGELTSKILWKSSCQPFETCICLEGKIADGQCHLDPVQFLVSKKFWMPKMMPKGLAPIDLEKLEEKGAVVFANLSLLGRRTNGKTTKAGEENGKATFGVEDGSGSQGTLSASGASSSETTSRQTTNITVPSSRSSDGENTPQELRGPKDGVKDKKGKGKIREKWKSFTKRIKK